VITSRSDTMDGVMMMLIVLALMLIVRSCQSGRQIWLLAGGATLGVAFDVKLLESLVAVPGLALLAYLGLPGSPRRRVLQMVAAGAVYVAVALAWLTATLLVPAHDRPYAIGSTNGSAWNAAFVFNGTDRLSGKSPEPQQTVYQPGRHYPVATQSERDQIPIVPPSPTRLLARIGPLSGERLGLELLVALLLGVPALLSGALRKPQRSQTEDTAGEGRLRIRRAVAVGVLLWALTGVVLFSGMARLHPRYVEGFTPALAAMLGIGAAWAASAMGRARIVILAGTLVITIVYAERLLYGRPGTWWIALAGALGAVTFAGLARLTTISAALRSALAPVGVLAMTSIAVLAIPLSTDVTAIKNHVTDAGYVGALPREEQRLVSAYLRSHQGGARYEVAAESATQVGSLIVQDARPIVVLTSYGVRVFTNVAKLERLIASGQVRYAFLNTTCGRRASALNAACSAPARWVRAHGKDVSRQAGLSRGKVLWLLPGASA
jgi:4-amino-4-deoxy-L-arabinose transferase-like glycosyltransferase